jgi:hypothetical protein
MVGGRARVLVVVAMLVACLIAPRARAAAQRATEEAEREYKLGYHALRDGDCAAALVHYRRSYELSPRPRTLFNMAVCEEELGLTVDAWHRYRAFLAAAEDRDAKIVVKARARIEALRATLTGKVAVSSNPPGATVSVDGGETRGVTPITLALAPGEHTIRLTMPAADPVERTVEVVPDQLETIALTLERLSSLVVVTDPADATIELDGEAVQVGRYEGLVTPGRHRLVVRRQGHRTRRLALDAVAGGTSVEHVRLEPASSTATLVIEGAPNAVVRVDGDAVPSSPVAPGVLSIRELQPGDHEIEVTEADVAWRDTVRVSDGEVVTVHLHLSHHPAWREPLGRGLGGLGVASLVGGSVLGVLALRDVASPSREEHDRGERRAWLADGLFVVSAVALVAAWRLLRGGASSASISRSFDEAR